MRSNLYIITFMAIITTILGFLLSIAATSLEAKQKFNEEVDIKKNILSSLNIPADRTQKISQFEIQELFDKRIKTLNLDEAGKPSDQGILPVYLASEEGSISGYSIPISGKGLWSTIYGYIALEPDGETVKGITFYKHGETPGLGGELEKDWFTSNYVGKKIYDGDRLVSIEIVKGHVNPNSDDAIHKVDGISGATLTGKGMNQFIAEDLETYKPFLDRIRSGEAEL